MFGSESQVSQAGQGVGGGADALPGCEAAFRGLPGAIAVLARQQFLDDGITFPQFR